MSSRSALSIRFCMKWKANNVSGLEVKSAPEASTRLLTPANVVTLVRICLVPVFVAALLSPWPEWFSFPKIAYESKSLIAAGIFVLISCTDWLDGYLARSRGEVTDFGKFMDPLADKILVVAALLALIELGALPSWVALIIVAREFIVSGVRMVAASKGVVIAASWYGKFKTVFQMIAIVMFTIKDSYAMGSLVEAFTDVMWVLSWIVMVIALVLTIVSMLDYISKARDLIGLGSLGRKGKDFQAAQAFKDYAKSEAASLPASGEPRRCVEVSELAAEVLDCARTRGLTLGTAESLTGGLISACLTSVPGSSDVVRGGVASYMVEVKEAALGVDSDVIAKDGVVSEAVALEMAQGALRVLSCDIAVAVTGIAGPGGAKPGRPVGSVCAACAGPFGNKTATWHFDGDRESVREQTVRAALLLIRDSMSC